MEARLRAVSQARPCGADCCCLSAFGARCGRGQSEVCPPSHRGATRSSHGDSSLLVKRSRSALQPGPRSCTGSECTAASEPLVGQGRSTDSGGRLLRLLEKQDRNAQFEFSVVGRRSETVDREWLSLAEVSTLRAASSARERGSRRSRSRSRTRQQETASLLFRRMKISCVPVEPLVAQKENPEQKRSGKTPSPTRTIWSRLQAHTCTLPDVDAPRAQLARIGSGSQSRRTKGPRPELGVQRGVLSASTNAGTDSAATNPGGIRCCASASDV